MASYTKDELVTIIPDLKTKNDVISFQEAIHSIISDNDAVYSLFERRVIFQKLQSRAKRLGLT